MRLLSNLMSLWTVMNDKSRLCQSHPQRKIFTPSFSMPLHLVGTLRYSQRECTRDAVCSVAPAWIWQVEMAGIFRSIKRVLTGEIIRRSDVPIMNGTCVMSFRLKRDGGGEYVVLAANAPGSHQYFPFDMNEFEKFVQAAINIRDALPAVLNRNTTDGIVE